MCGIVGVIRPKAGTDPDVRARVLKSARLLRHRGPDWSGVHVQPGAILAHERLAIVDPDSGGQPLLDPTEQIALAANGEIYNHRGLRALHDDYPFRTGSDCEVILPLWIAKGDALVPELDGMFAFILSDARTGDFLVARDPMGIVPLYWGVDHDGGLWFASEMKAIREHCAQYDVFPPGHLWSSTSGGLKRWYDPSWMNAAVTPERPVDLNRIREGLEASVVKRMMTDVPWGVLLSGGLDSSLVAAIAARHAAKRVEDDERSPAWWPRLHTFSVGLVGSPDLAAARKVADTLGTAHHEYTFTVQDGIDALSDVIWHLETYDVTTIRASTPMYLMARKIKAMGVKMVLSGEGSDEVFAGYLYFHKAPNAGELHQETLRKLSMLHLYDCLRANKSMAAWGVEARVPFLDKAFLAEAMSIDPTDKLSSTHPGGPRMEKALLRRAFDTPENPYMPHDVLWRQKEQFSDGVGYGWIDALKAHAESSVTDAMLAQAAFRFPYNPPATKEAYLYRSLFTAHFPEEAAAKTVPGGPSVACSTPTAIAWDAAFSKSADPSGRAVAGVHNAAYRG